MSNYSREELQARFDSYRSVRQELLPSAAKDVIAWALACNIRLVDHISMSAIKAVEVKLDGALDHLYYGGAGVYFHPMEDSIEVYSHRDDPEWAVVFSHDCEGDAERGVAIIQFKRGVISDQVH